MSDDDNFFDAPYDPDEFEAPENFITLGEEINLNEKDPALHNITIGLGWDVKSLEGEPVDMDGSLFLLDKHGQTRVDEDFVFYNQPRTLEGAVRHNGDSRTGAGDGDDETISIDLQKLPFDIVQLMFVVSIYKGEERDHHMEMVRNVYARIISDDTQHELVRYKMDEDLKGKQETAVVVAAINREGPKWHFKPICEFVPGGLGAVAKRYGLDVVKQ